MRITWVFALAACGGTSPGHPDASGDAGLDAAADAAADAPAICPAATVVSTATATEVTVAGDPGEAAGIFDASIVYPGDATAGAMSYSAVDQGAIRTRLAVSADHGTTWTYVGDANTPEAATLASSDATDCPTGSCTGTLISEVSSLIYDADDPDTTKRWKLFAHRYLLVGTRVDYRLGTITLQTAASPDGAWTAPAKLIGWSSPAPYTSAGVTVNINQLPGTAADCVTLTEPGAMWHPGAIELALGCIYIANGAPKIRVELLRSTDHGTSWASAGTLLRPEDAACLTPGASINAADLFASGGTVYVAASPSDDSGYHGCLVFPIDDLATAKIHRDAMGHALPSRTIAVDPTRFSGACTFADGAAGYLLPVAFLDQPPRVFRMFHTAITAP